MDKLFGGIYKGKRVLITGHTGFKGSWLALWLTSLGANVTGYALQPPTKPNHFDLLDLHLTSTIANILDREALRSALEQCQPDIVFHLAAQPIVRESYAFPVETFDTNIMGTVHVLDACRSYGKVQAIVNITSDKCYQNIERLEGYTESDPMGGDDPYSASKGAAEIVSQAFRHSFFNPKDYGHKHHTLMANVRAGNVIGGGDWAKDRLIPDIMRATNAGEPVTIRNPQAVRPWQHVLEPLSGYLHLGWKLLEGEAAFADNWNFGPLDSASLTVGEVTTFAQKYWDEIKFTVQPSVSQVHEATLLVLDSSKARKQLQWQSLWDNEKTFARTVEWYKDFYQRKQLNSNRDLAEYVNDARKAGVLWANT
jgi:CDP-glucose 4,6-dehydratase